MRSLSFVLAAFGLRAQKHARATPERPGSSSDGPGNHITRRRLLECMDAA